MWLWYIDDGDSSTDDGECYPSLSPSPVDESASSIMIINKSQPQLLFASTSSSAAEYQSS